MTKITQAQEISRNIISIDIQLQSSTQFQALLSLPGTLVMLACGMDIDAGCRFGFLGQPLTSLAISAILILQQSSKLVSIHVQGPFRHQRFLQN